LVGVCADIDAFWAENYLERVLPCLPIVEECSILMAVMFEAANFPPATEKKRKIAGQN
jgi:hypothetical protein